MFLATVVYDNGNGLATEIFLGKSQIEVEEKAINDIYAYVLGHRPSFYPSIEQQLEEIDDCFSSNGDDRVDVNIFNLETGERVRPEQFRRTPPQSEPLG